MNKEDRQKMLLAQGFKRKQKIKSKVVPKYPMSDEREYKRIARGYMKLFESVLDEYDKDIETFLKSRLDASGGDFELNKLIAKIEKAMTVKMGRYELSKKIWKLAQGSHYRSVREWRRAIYKTLGINLKEDYFKGEKYERLLKEWSNKNVNLIKTIPYTVLGKMKEIVNDGLINGKTVKAVKKEILRSYAVEENYAEFVAVDQLGKLSSDLNKMQQTSVGVKHYIWSTSKDARVRMSHRILHGKEFAWNNPPCVDVKNQRYCHPGEDYRCRCVAIPYFEKKELNIPVDAVDWDKVDEHAKQIFERNRRNGR